MADCFATVAVKRPVARRTVPFGLGTSCEGARVVRMSAVMATWPRISPAGFMDVWTFTYALPFWMAASVALSSLAVPEIGLAHGPQRNVPIGPVCPLPPRWM